MKTKTYTYLHWMLGWSILIIFAGCAEKTLPIPMEGEPVFYIEAEIGGKEIKLEAGKDKYYLNSTYAEYSDSLMEYSGSFEKANCPTCGEKLKIVIRDGQKRVPGTQIDPDHIFHTGMHPFHFPSTDSGPLSFRFTGKSEGVSPLSYQWDFGDGETSEEENPVHTFKRSGFFQVTLASTDADGCTDQTYRYISTGRKYRDCKTSFEYLPRGNGKVAFIANIESMPRIKLIAWDFGDGSTPLIFPMHLRPTHEYSMPGVYTVSLLVIDEDNCTALFSRNIYAEPGASCVSLITYEKVEEPLLNSVYVEWTDENGESFTSNTWLQPSGSNFEVLISQPNKHGNPGEFSQEISFALTCTLFHISDSTHQLDLVRGEGKMALFYP